MTVGASGTPPGRAPPTMVADPRAAPPAAGDICGISRSDGGGIGVATQFAKAAITSAGFW